ncbi:hypothetical protein [Facilibium subflavum]|uniref:hypothetical protein n=1 Tax=Facilibium subflavum TaxID=2219058 RepID=UPI000E646B26|nr:hypothetical protein [Facilibium subflavum]
MESSTQGRAPIIKQALEMLKDTLKAQLGVKHHKYSGISQADTFQKLLQVACQKYKTHFYSRPTGTTETMKYLKNILDGDEGNFSSFRDFLLPRGKSNEKVSFSAMRYYAMYGSLEGSEGRISRARYDQSNR